jgi:hypothetical protein|tara:strand:+ start:216 stop:359 length:144 start_codon:yes stop_codon:yes gene_type:complete
LERIAFLGLCLGLFELTFGCSVSRKEKFELNAMNWFKDKRELEVDEG